MLKLIRLTLNTFAVEDSDMHKRQEVAVGSMLEAKSYLKDFHGTTDEEFARACAEMLNRGTNTAHFGINGGFIFSERLALDDLNMRVSLHMNSKARA